MVSLAPLWLFRYDRLEWWTQENNRRSIAFSTSIRLSANQQHELSFQDQLEPDIDHHQELDQTFFFHRSWRRIRSSCSPPQSCRWTSGPRGRRTWTRTWRRRPPPRWRSAARLKLKRKRLQELGSLTSAQQGSISLVGTSTGIGYNSRWHFADKEKICRLKWSFMRG